MSNNLPQIYNENILKKFFNYVRKLFSFNKNEVKQEIKINDTNKQKESLKNNFLKDIKIEDGMVDKEFEKKKIMDDLKDNLQLLEECSNEKLEKILQYYLKENEDKKKLLKKLSA